MSPIQEAETLEQGTLRGRSTEIRRRHVSQSVEPFVLRAGPGIVRVVNSERCTLNARLLAGRVVFNPFPSLSLVTPDSRHALLGSGLAVCIPKGRDGRHRMARARRGAETASKSGQPSVLHCVGEFGKRNREVLTGVRGIM